MRTKITLTATATAALMAAFLSLPAGATLTAKKLCDNFGGQTIVASSTSRIYMQQYVIDDEKGVIGVGVHRCRPGSTAPPQTIARYASKDENPVIYPVSGTLRGRYLLLEYVDETSSVKHTLRLYDLAAKKLLARYDRAGSSSISDYLTARGGVGVITSKGLAAFDASGGRLAAPTGLHDVGAGLESLYWRSGDTPSGAVLAGPPTGVLTDPSA